MSRHFTKRGWLTDSCRPIIRTAVSPAPVRQPVPASLWTLAVHQLADGGGGHGKLFTGSRNKENPGSHRRCYLKKAHRHLRKVRRAMGYTRPLDGRFVQRVLNSY